MANDKTEPKKLSPRLIVFDLDGTLLDTFEDIAQAANHVLNKYGKPSLDVRTVKGYVGHGGRNLMRDCLLHDGDGEVTEENVDEAFEGWRRYYAEHPTDYSKTYPGVEPTLTTLRERGYRLAALSNKSDDLVQTIAQDLKIDGYLDAIQGELDSVPRKPDPALLRQLMARFRATPEETVMVGDGEADMKVARNAGVRAIATSYGVNSAERLRELGAWRVIDRFPALLDLLA